MILIIEGSDKKVKQLARELKVRARRSNLKLSLKETGKPDMNTKQKTADVIALIEKVENVKDLKQFESDKRATVVKAIETRKEELDLT